MSPVMCQNFVQNAWKKDLCSNCFKAREEHNVAALSGIKSRYTSKILNGGNQVGKNGFTDNYQPQSIMKTDKKITNTSTKSAKNNVNFPKDVSEIIGYGGEEWSEYEEFELSEESPDDEKDLAPDDDAERELQRLTKSNTDFNTVNANLLGETSTSVMETRKVFANLMLGKPQMDSDGKKQTLMVSVTPFGQESPKKMTAITTKTTEKKLTHVPIAKNKDSLAENKIPVVLTSYSKNEIDSPTIKDEKSLLEEINETLEKNKTMLMQQMKNSKNESLNNSEQKGGITLENSEYIKTKAECIFINDSDEIKKPPINNNPTEPRKNGLTRHPAIKREQEKPVVQMKDTKSLTESSNMLLERKRDEPRIVDVKPVVEATSPLLVKTEIRYIQNELLNVNNESNEISNDVTFISETTANLRKIEGQSNTTEISQTKICFEKTSTEEVQLNLSPIKYTENIVFDVEASRELAGEPDGRADPDVSEPPALPLTPPPISSDPRPSFLHSPTKRIIDKPKIPAKPNKILSATSAKKVLSPMAPQSISSSDNENLDNISTDSMINCENNYESLPLKMPLTKQDSTGSDNNRNSNKRRAPKPPATPTQEDACVSNVYQRNYVNSSNHDSPVVREKEKRERASSCSPKLRNGAINPNPTGESTPNLSLIPEPAPRRSLSLSQDSLSSGNDRVDEKKKRGRFSLKKFLRMGTTHSKDNDKIIPNSVSSSKNKSDDPKLPLPHPKPRLVIVHPNDLNGSNIEVVKTDNCQHSTEDSASTSNDSTSSGRDTPSPLRPCKPPPPPRANIDEWKEKSTRHPLPPKNDELIRQQKIWNNNNSAYKKSNPKENIYANVGEVRAILTPSKPVRTASMREREAALEAQKRRNAKNINGGYEQVELRAKDPENEYDFINGQRSSSPECDSNIGGKNSPSNNNNSNIRCRNGLVLTPRRSEGSLENSPEYIMKFHGGGYPRTTSLPYCGSETESEIYSPYSFYSCETDVGDDESDWATNGTRTCRLRSRKGRSIVHKNLEDNYGAVVVANHEALAQVLEHMHQTTAIQPALRGLKTAPNLRWCDFSLVDNNGTAVRVGRRCFHTALWGAHHVTLTLTTLEQGSLLQTNTLSLAPFTLTPITEFSDLVPINYLPITPTSSDNSKIDAKIVQATIAVLPWMQVDTIQSMGTLLRSKVAQSINNNNSNCLNGERMLVASPVNVPVTEELYCREACFILLQLVNGLKCLQAHGIEELPLSLTSFALCRELERDTHPRLCILQGLSEEISRIDILEQDDRLGSLCECALTALKQLLPPSSNLTTLLEDLLRQERAVSLTQVKSVLEFTLWGPSDVAHTTPIKDRELALQRWLDLERATVLHGLVRTRVQLTVFEEFHLLFLVRSTAKIMCEASVLLDTISAQT